MGFEPARPCSSLLDIRHILPALCRYRWSSFLYVSGLAYAWTSGGIPYRAPRAAWLSMTASPSAEDNSQLVDLPPFHRSRGVCKSPHFSLTVDRDGCGSTTLSMKLLVSCPAAISARELGPGFSISLRTGGVFQRGDPPASRDTSVAPPRCDRQPHVSPPAPAALNRANSPVDPSR